MFGMYVSQIYPLKHKIQNEFKFIDLFVLDEFLFEQYINSG